MERGQLRRGQQVFIQAGSGGVGTIAIQLAKHLGATVATTTSTANLDLVRRLGADVVIDYKQEDFAAKLRGYDLVLHSQDARTLARSWRVLRPGVRLVSISGPPYPAFAPGALSLTVRDTTDGGVGAATLPASTALGGTRSGTTGFQIGALSSQRVTVEIADLRAGALGFSANLNTAGLGSLDDLVSAGAIVNGRSQEVLEVIDAALAEVNRVRGATGSLQGNTVERVMESLRGSAVNLRDFEGLLRDVDMAAESAEFSRVQVMIQAATAMLAQANQVPQSVLQLLK